MLKTAVRGGLYKVKVRSFAGPYRPSIECVKNGNDEAILQAGLSGVVEPRNGDLKLFPPKPIAHRSSPLQPNAPPRSPLAIGEWASRPGSKTVPEHHNAPPRSMTRLASLRLDRGGRPSWGEAYLQPNAPPRSMTRLASLRLDRGGGRRRRSADGRRGDVSRRITTAPCSPAHLTAR